VSESLWCLVNVEWSKSVKSQNQNVKKNAMHYYYYFCSVHVRLPFYGYYHFKPYRGEILVSYWWITVFNILYHTSTVTFDLNGYYALCCFNFPRRRCAKQTNETGGWFLERPVGYFRLDPRRFETNTVLAWQELYHSVSSSLWPCQWI